MYSTHSHYLINPEWLNQAFIISNASMEYNDLNVGSEQKSRYTDVDAIRYRKFVGVNPDKTTYFQPVLDRLQIVPSRLDALRPSVLVEGKGDYLVLAYGIAMLGLSPDYAVIPTRGADHFDELVGIMLGWGVNFALCCDDDTPGRKAVSDFRDNWGMPPNRVFTIAEFESSLKGKTIEGILEESDRKLIADYFEIIFNPTKSQVQLYFSEHLAKKLLAPLSDAYFAKVKSFDRKIREALSLKPASAALEQTSRKRKRK